MRRMPHDVPYEGTGDPNNEYAQCSSCGASVYVGSGLHANLVVPMQSAEAEARLRRRGY